jgi:hypothetical protein
MMSPPSYTLGGELEREILEPMRSYCFNCLELGPSVRYPVTTVAGVGCSCDSRVVVKKPLSMLGQSQEGILSDDVGIG